MDSLSTFWGAAMAMFATKQPRAKTALFLNITKPTLYAFFAKKILDALDTHFVFTSATLVKVSPRQRKVTTSRDAVKETCLF